MNFVGIIFSGILCENSVLLGVNIVCKMCLYSCTASVACSVSCSLSACTTVRVTITVRCLKCWHWLFNIIIVAVSLCYRIHILARERQRISDNACQRQQGTNDIWSVYNTSVSSIFYTSICFYAFACLIESNQIWHENPSWEDSLTVAAMDSKSYGGYNLQSSSSRHDKFISFFMTDDVIIWLHLT